MWTALRDFVVTNSPLSYWLIAFVGSTFAVAVYRGFFRARKIQPKGFRWITFRNEFIFAVINLAISATVLGYLTTTLTAKGIIAFNPAPTSWWVIGLEYAAYFFLFDTWFYWNHRLMHIEPIYKWVHKLHHRSTSPNLLTTLSVSPLESLVNGGFVPLFTALLTVHDSTMALIAPTSIIMGFYVHSGYEFLPRWWNKTWATKWFISATFHDQHHKYFKWNFGGYTTIWDWICGTVRPKHVEEFEQIKARARQPLTPSVAPAGPTPEV
jgi:sterol desaturase/sphingolipid hydroxylase (fatty acid hydroxylase superfamily)